MAPSPFSRGLIIGFISALVCIAVLQQILNLYRSAGVNGTNESYPQSAGFADTKSEIAQLIEKKQQLKSQQMMEQHQAIFLPNDNLPRLKTVSKPVIPVQSQKHSESASTAVASAGNLPSAKDESAIASLKSLLIESPTSTNAISRNEESSQLLTSRPLVVRDNRLQQLRNFGIGAFDKMKGAIATVIEKGSQDEMGGTISSEGAAEASTESVSHAISSSEPSISKDSSSAGKYSRRYCEAKKYNRLTYLPENKKQLPPMLYTFPGSGNTWGRLLIEHATGVFTGSVYNDQSLLDALPGEFTCDWRVSVVKVHPHTHSFADLYSGHFGSDNGKCKRGGVMRFERAVLLIRNPFDSIWSEYQRRVTQSHVEGILRRTFDWSRWQANAASLSNSYNQMWGVHYRGIEEKFEPENILYLRYEDLKDKKTRVATLKKVVDFLHIEVSGDLMERLECAFALSESTQAHRTIDPDIDMTKEVAYTKELSCRMYALFGKHIIKHNYTSWKNWDCTGYPPIGMVNVGPRGEYNRLWVQPGGQLLDFGGHEQSQFDPNAVQKKGGGGRGGGAGRGGGGRGGAGRGGAGAGRGGGAGRGKPQNAGLLAEGQDASSVPSKKILTGQMGGMTMQEAAKIPGVGALGASKPAWAS